MFKVNDIVYIHDIDEREDGHHASNGDICIILKVFEGGTDPWTGVYEDENYQVLNESNGQTITLSWTTTLKKYDKPYTRKSASELEKARKQYYRNWIEKEKQEMEEEASIYGGYWMCKEFVEEIQELENDYYNKNKYTKEYFNEKIVKLVYGFNSCSRNMNEKQLEYRDELWEKYIEGLED